MAWDFAGDRPIYSQLVEKIKLKILSGEYRAGQRLPAIRDLAAEAAVNPNTMQKAFAELEQLGLVYAQRTTGRFITDEVEKIDEIRRQYAEKSVRDFIAQTKSLGYTSEEIKSLFEEIMKGESI